MNYPEYESKKRRNFGFSVGFIGGLIMVFVSLAVFFMNGADTNGDIFVWFIQLFVYFLVGRIAASKQADGQEDSYEPTKGVAGAGVGAALVTATIMWVFIILRGIIRDAMGMYITIEPISFCGWIIIDILLALGIGRLAGRSIEKQHDLDSYDTNNF